MTELQDIIGQIPMGQIAGLLGTDEPTARAAVEAAVPTLLAGMHSNAQAPDGAASLQSALGQHQDGLIDGGVDVAQVDTADGEKIVDHVFGGQQDHVASQLAGSGQLGGAGSDLVRKLLPILAPIVMSYLAQKFLGGSQTGVGSPVGDGAASGSGQGSGVDLGGVLGGILGGMVGGQGGQGSAAGQAGPGGQGGQGEQGGFGGLGDILGGLFGKK
ncbi:DUF937 domain-containing protein [Arthrobacter sp. ov118]|uniref:DUF937 domain-containing protein n=1 Tax=Arthrobacter sp. ov118 TaxID=1761747 RepID=UPI0008E0BA19|nr:DUF937 domain-containing protein [Arthrobacter sp. ov118]SFU05894.1 protein of unknown function [Arthrobacter sp. ov118]